jgi:hypothetical protein
MFRVIPSYHPLHRHFKGVHLLHHQKRQFVIRTRNSSTMSTSSSPSSKDVVVGKAGITTDDQTNKY